ncbi:tetratricopeptide repeat protein [Breznakibacter xylanolyticus]|nr:tetratricopeptide repeat protein [Breznakibacter xylanolyticus]
MHKLLVPLMVSCLMLQVPAFAQSTYRNTTPEPAYTRAVELFEHQKYGSARQAFHEWRTQHANMPSPLLPEAAFMEARCAQLLKNSDAAYLYDKFLIDFPESNKIPFVYFHSGEIMQEAGKFKQASLLYAKVDANALDETTRYDYWFKSGYCLFMQEDYDRSLNYFLKVKDANTQWKTPTLYYYSHIMYMKGKYDTALQGFRQLEKEPAFSKIVPFYIAQIYYLQKDYDKAISYAEPLIATATGDRKTDMNRIVGSAYFAKKNYAQAIPYLESAVQATRKPSREDYYNLGFSHYYQKNYDKAADYLSKVTSADDVMSQNAYYHLGECYIQIDDKKRARVAFEAAAKYDFDKSIQEDAMFNHLKLNYEMAFSPFNEIINGFIKFIDTFPNSSKIDQAYDYLGKAFLTSKNYKQALDAMKSIKSKNANTYKAMQRIAYYRGLELYTSLQFKDAIDFFTLSLANGEYDKDLKVKAMYWRGEAYYRLGYLDKAKTDYNSFILNSASYRLPEYKTAHYNMGYVFFKEKNYSESGNWFRNYARQAGSEKSAMVADAYNRIGDCLYVNRDFNGAIGYYQYSANISSVSPDYASYQIAYCHGLLRNHDEKITLLKKLIAQYPNSQYVDDAYYEIGRSYVAINQLNDAIYHYKIVKEKFPQSTFANKAMLQLGLVYYNSGDLDNSLAFYKRVVNEFPNTAEAQDALLGIRNIYMDRNDPDGYFAYTATVKGLAKTADSEKDSLTFESAQRLYMKEDCDRAVPLLRNYTTSYANGRYIIDAHYYLAECLMKQNQSQEAVVSYDYLADAPRHLYTEEAIIRSGSIHYNANRPDKALQRFEQLEPIADMAENKLEARIGQLRCLVKLNRTEAIISAADKVLTSPKLAPEIEREARFAKAKANLAMNDKTAALNDFKLLSANTRSTEGAESKYLVAQLAYDGGNDAEAEKVIFELADTGTPHQYWLAKSFILLSDIYLKRGENFQAQQYLESILENYDGKNDDIHAIATQRLNAIKAL